LDTFLSFAFSFLFPFVEEVSDLSDLSDFLSELSDEVAETNRGLLEPEELLRVRAEAWAGDLDRDEARDFSEPV
jgi:hypothetical protein